MDPERIAKIRENVQRTIDGMRADGFGDDRIDTEVQKYLRTQGYTPDTWQNALDSIPPMGAAQPVTQPGGPGLMSKIGMGLRAAAVPLMPKRETQANRQAGRGFAREMAQGATFGASDEIEAALTPQSLADVQAKRDAYAEGGGPVLIPQLLGAVPTALAAGAGIAPAIGRSTAGLSWSTQALARLAALTAVGSGGGAVTGALSAPPGERAESAVSGAKWGFMLAPLGMGSAGAGRGTGRFLEAASGYDVPQKARVAGARYLEPDLAPGQSFTDLAADLREGDVIADLTGRTQRMGKRSLAGDPDNAGDIYRAMQARNTGLIGDVRQATGDLVGAGGTSRAGVQQTVAREQRRFYDKAYNALYDEMDRAGITSSDEMREVFQLGSNYAKRGDNTLHSALEAARAEMGGFAESVGGSIPDDLMNAEVLERTERVLREIGKNRTVPNWGTAARLSRKMREALGKHDAYGEIRSLYARREIATKASAGQLALRDVKASPLWKSVDGNYLRDWWRQADEPARRALRDHIATDVQSEVAKRLPIAEAKAPKAADTAKAAFKYLDGLKDRLEVVYGPQATRGFYDVINNARSQTETFLESMKGVAAIPTPQRETLWSNLLAAVGYATSGMQGASFRTLAQTAAHRSSLDRAFDTEIAQLLFQQDPRRGLQMLDDVQPFLERMRRTRQSQDAGVAVLGGMTGGLLANR